MLLLMAMLAQDIVGPPGDEPAPRATLTRRRDCVRRDDEIVVCGTGESQRLLSLPEPGTKPVFGPATVRLSPNKSMTARTESSGNAHLPAPRLMLDFKLDF